MHLSWTSSRAEKEGRLIYVAPFGIARAFDTGSLSSDEYCAVIWDQLGDPQLASLTRLWGETQDFARPSTKPQVSSLAVSSLGGVLSPLPWLMFLN